MVQIQPEMVTLKIEKTLPYERAIKLLEMIKEFDYSIQETSTVMSKLSAYKKERL